jgi:hypothetical protein
VLLSQVQPMPDQSLKLAGMSFLSRHRLLLPPYAFRGRDAPAQDCTPDGPTLSDQEAVICAADSGIGQQ